MTPYTVSIAVDGPAASGKGTLARALAERFDFAYLDTGSLYRAVALHSLDRGVPLEDPAATAHLATDLKPEDIANIATDPRLRAETTGGFASIVAAHVGVRTALLAFQRRFATSPPKEKQGAILDGRDIGTVVLPNADLKFYVTATPQARAQRRFLELKNTQTHAPNYEACLSDIRIRDERDTARSLAPLRAAHDAVMLDTTSLSAQEVLFKASQKLKALLSIQQQKA